jgi:hypothetical protein
MRNLVNVAAAAGMTLVVASTVVVNLTGFGNPKASGPVTAGLAPAAGCSGGEWASSLTGQKLRDNKRAAVQQRNSSTAVGATIEMANKGDFAYGSLPAGVSKPGTYSFLFGPVPDSFQPGRNPVGLAFAFPPDFAADMVVTGEPQPGIVVKDGVRYFQQAFVINSVNIPCATLVAWIY